MRGEPLKHQTEPGKMHQLNAANFAGFLSGSGFLKVQHLEKMNKSTLARHLNGLGQTKTMQASSTVSSLPNTIPNIAAPSTPDRIAPRADETSRARNDDRFADRLDRQTSRSESSRNESSRSESSRQETSRSETSRSETSRSETSRQESSRSETDREERTEASDKSDASSQTASSDNAGEHVASDDTNNQETPTGTTAQGEEQATDEVELSLDAALAFLSEMEGAENTELTITARSGETISLTPPATAPNGQSEPGSLSRWFVEASGSAGHGPAGLGTAGLRIAGLGPAGLGAAGPGGQMAGLLAKMGTGTSQTQTAGQTPDLASLIGQGDQAGQKLAGPTADSTALSSGQPTSFADAMASANTSTETMDAMMGQAMAKAAAALDAGTSATAPVTPGPTIATGAQPTMTAVPQSTAGQAVPVAALAIEINRQAMSGKTQFEIRLDPPELGRLNVRLEVDTNGQTRTHMVVERGETLDMLTTDSRSLERALQQAGLKAEPGSVTFELSQDFNEGLAQNGDQSETGENSGNDDASNGTPSGDENLIPELTDMSSIEAVRQQLHLTGHLDVRV